MRQLSCLLVCFLLCLPLAGFAKDIEQLEITLKETPHELYEQTLKQTGFPFTFKKVEEFNAIAAKQNLMPDELHRDLELLARLNLETNVNNPNKKNDAQTIINLLEIIASTAYEESRLIMLKARQNARVNQAFSQAIIDYNDALNKISSDTSLEATLHKYILHEDLSELHYMQLQPVQALTHLEKHREIAYLLRNDYFISETESALGLHYNRNKNLVKSLQHYSEAFRIANRLKYPRLKANAQFSLAKIHRDLEQWDDALKYAHDATTSFMELKHEALVADSLTVIAIIYAEQKQWHKAIDYYLNSLQVNRRLGNEIAEALNYHNLAEVNAEINNYPEAIKYISKAHAIFNAKKLDHYLIYNELLFAKILLAQEKWQDVIPHAQKAVELAKKKGLLAEHIEALTQLSTAYRQFNKLDLAINAIDQVLVLTQKLEKDQTSQTKDSELTEQKLKFELSLLQSKLTQRNKETKQNRFNILILLGLSLLIISTLAFLLHKTRKSNQRGMIAQQQQLLDPITQLPGYPSLIQQLNNQASPELKTLALIDIEKLVDTDLQLGLTESIKLMQYFIQQFEQHLQTKVFVIKQGQIACCFEQVLTGDDILKTTIECVKSLDTLQSAIPRFKDNKFSHKIAIGHINFPLLDNPDLHISAELKMETVQYALATAKELKQQDAYITLRALNFAPAAIFQKPLYLNLTQGLSRGIIKAESNHSTLDITWPSLKVQS